MSYDTEFNGSFAITDRIGGQPGAGQVVALFHAVAALNADSPDSPGFPCPWMVVVDDETPVEQRLLRRQAWLEWDGCNGAREYVAWLHYIVQRLLRPAGLALDGVVEWRGEEWDDCGAIRIKGNVIDLGTVQIAYPKRTARQTA